MAHPGYGKLPRLFQKIEAGVTVDHVDQSARIERHVVALRSGPARYGLRDEIAHLARALRIGNVDDAQSAGEPDGMDERAGHVLAELVRAEARAARAAKGRVELADLELPERLDVGDIGDVERQYAGMRPAAT